MVIAIIIAITAIGYVCIHTYLTKGSREEQHTPTPTMRVPLINSDSIRGWTGQHSCIEEELRNDLGKIVQGLRTRDLLLKHEDVTLGPRLGSGASGNIYTGFFACDVAAKANVALKETFQGMICQDTTEILHEVQIRARVCMCIIYYLCVFMGCVFGISGCIVANLVFCFWRSPSCMNR